MTLDASPIIDAADDRPGDRNVEAGGCAPPIVVTRAPDPVERPLLALYLFERDLDYVRAAELIGGVSHMSVSNWCRPFGDSKRRVPRRAALERIAAFSGGAVTEASFRPPHPRPPTSGASR